MKMTIEEYLAYVDKKTPNSPILRNVAVAFLIGGLICCIGQAIIDIATSLGVSEENAPAIGSITLIFLGALLTGLGVYDEIARIAGAGTLVPITGFSNAVVSPALEFKSEGFVTGMAAKMFIIAGPVIVFGTLASVICGIIYLLLGTGN